MKLIFTCFVSLFVIVCQDLADIRDKYMEAYKSHKNSEEFHALVSGAPKENKVMQAYKGASIALKAKFVKDRKSKKDLFVEGVKMVENSIKSEPNNIELRLIRMSIQENTPKILNYKSNLDEDKKLILTNFKKQNQSLKEYIRIYVSQSKLFSENEKSALN